MQKHSKKSAFYPIKVLQSVLMCGIIQIVRKATFPGGCSPARGLYRMEVLNMETAWIDETTSETLENIHGDLAVIYYWDDSFEL